MSSPRRAGRDHRFRKILYGALALVTIGVVALWISTTLGGFGGDTGRSMWWGVLFVPYGIGILMGFGAAVVLAETFEG